MQSPTLESWLKRRVRQQVLGYALVGLASALAGVVVLLVTIYLTFFVLLWISIHVFAGFELLGWRMPSIYSYQSWLVVASALFLALLFIANATTDREYLGRLPKVTWSAQSPAAMFDAAGKIITDLLFTGPRLVVSTPRLLRRIFRLERFDFRIGSEILALLASRDSRVSFREICDQIAGVNPVGIFPQFRYLEGVVFLTKDPAGLSLTDELRSEIRAVVGSVEAGHAGPNSNAEQDLGFDSDVHSGRLNSYEVLGIGPSATLQDARAAYRRLMKEHHPDRLAGLGDELRELAEEHAKEINRAYEDICAMLRQAQTV
jgi:hypothetical protein